MRIMHAVICHNANTGQELNIAGWSANDPEARELESQLNDLAGFLTGNASATPLVEYYTASIPLYGCTAEYQAYGDFDALIRNGIFHAIVPAGQGEHYLHLHENADIVHCTNILKGLDNYLS